MEISKEAGVEKTKEKSSYKARKAEELKRNYDEETNWNYLFINPNAVAGAMASKLNVTKGELLSKEADNVAVRLALSETHMIKEIKDWLKENGVNDSVFHGQTRRTCKRSDKIILIKNISLTVNEPVLREIFERYGTIKRLLLSPSNTLAMVEYYDAKSAAVAIKKISYSFLHDLPLYLEYAPEGTLEEGAKPKEEEKKIPEKEDANTVKYGRSIFVKNLSFDTTEAKLADHFDTAKVGKIASVTVVKNKNTNKSMGYGFVEYLTEEAAIEAIKTLQNSILDEHALKLSISKKKLSEKQIKEEKTKLKRKAMTEEDNPDKEDQGERSTKLLVKNLAFEATKNDLKLLFGSFGQIKKIRIPKKYDGSFRGFGFVEYYTKEDAKNAFKSLQSSHLYGRKLVIQWAKDETASVVQLQERTVTLYPNIAIGKEV